MEEMSSDMLKVGQERRRQRGTPESPRHVRDEGLGVVRAEAVKGGADDKEMMRVF